MDSRHAFPQGMLADNTLAGHVVGALVPRGCTGCCVGPPLRSTTVVAPTGGGCSLVVGLEPPRVSFAQVPLPSSACAAAKGGDCWGKWEWDLCDHGGPPCSVPLGSSWRLHPFLCCVCPGSSSGRLCGVGWGRESGCHGRRSCGGLQPPEIWAASAVVFSQDPSASEPALSCSLELAELGTLAARSVLTAAIAATPSPRPGPPGWPLPGPVCRRVRPGCWARVRCHLMHVLTVASEAPSKLHSRCPALSLESHSPRLGGPRSCTRLWCRVSRIGVFTPSDCGVAKAQHPLPWWLASQHMARRPRRSLDSVSAFPSRQGVLSPLCGIPGLEYPDCGSPFSFPTVRVYPWEPSLPEVQVLVQTLFFLY